MIEFIQRLSILCFAGTYGLALAAELARRATRAPARWYAALGFTALGWVVQGAYLVNAGTPSGSEPPMAGSRDSLLALAWILAAVDLYLILHVPRNVGVGIFVLPVVLGLIGAAVLGGPGRADWGGGWTTFWGAVHGVFLLLGAVCTCVAFVAGLMYLRQADRLKRKRPPRFGLSLPSLEQSERWNRGAITLAFPLLTAGLLIGLALVVATARGPSGPLLSWGDPKVVATLAAWLVFALLLHARFRPEWRGKRVMFLTIVAAGFLAFSMAGVGLVLPTAHGGRP